MGKSVNLVNLYERKDQCQVNRRTPRRTDIRETEPPPLELKWEAAGEVGKHLLWRLCKSIWINKQQSKVVFVPLSKKGNIKVCSNYRTDVMSPTLQQLCRRHYDGSLEWLWSGCRSWREEKEQLSVCWRHNVTGYKKRGPVVHHASESIITTVVDNH